MLLIQIDKSGTDLSEKNYSIVIIANKNDRYGINLSDNLKNQLLNAYNCGEFGFFDKIQRKARKKFLIRFHTSIIICLLENILSKYAFSEMQMEICNDYDHHFHEIKEMIYTHISRKYTIKRQDIVQARFHKPNIIDDTGKALRNKNYTNISIPIITYTQLHTLLKK